MLHAARANWQWARDRMAALGVTEDERATLEPALRRKAVLDAAPMFVAIQVHTWPLIPIAVLLVVLPVAVAALTGTSMTIGHLVLIYLYYLPCLLAGLVALIATGLGILIALDEWPRWLLYATVLASAAVVTAGMAFYWIYLRDTDATFLLSLFVGIVAYLLILVVFVVAAPFAVARRQRRIGVLGIDHLAGLMLFDVWEALGLRRMVWRTSTGREELLRMLSSLANAAPGRLARSVRVNGGDRPQRHWAATLGRHLGQTIQDHRNRLLRIDQHQQYAALVTTVRRQTVAVCQGDWTVIERAAGAARPRRGVLGLLARLAVPLVLVGAAVGVGYLPGLTISADTLFTVRLSLVVPAILSLLPIKPGNQEAITSALRDALGLIKR